MSVRKSLAWSYGAQAFIFVVTFGSSVVVARILGPFEMGVFAIAMATTGLLSILSSFGVGPYLVRHEALDATTTATVFTINALLNLLISLMMVGVVVVGPWFEINDGVRRVLALMALVPLIGIFEFLPSTLFQREMNFRVIAIVSMGRSLVTSCAVVGFALAGFGSVSPALAIVGASIYAAIVFNVIGRRHASVRLGLTGWRDITKFGLHMMSIGGVANIAQRLSEIILGRLAGLAALGIYVRASSLSNQIWDNVYGLATRVIFSQMADEMRDTGTVSKTFLSGISIITALVWPLLMGIATLSGPMILLLYGPKWLDAALPLTFLVIAHLIGLGFGMNWELCVLTNKTGWQARVEATRAVIGVSTFSLGALIGLAAAASARIVDALIGLAFYGPKMRQLAGTRRGEISRVYRQSMVLTIAAVAPVAALMASTGWSPTTSWTLIVPSIGIGIGLWFATLRLFRHDLLREMARALKHLQSLSRPRTS